MCESSQKGKKRFSSEGEERKKQQNQKEEKKEAPAQRRWNRSSNLGGAFLISILRGAVLVPRSLCVVLLPSSSGVVPPAYWSLFDNGTGSTADNNFFLNINQLQLKHNVYELSSSFYKGPTQQLIFWKHFFIKKHDMSTFPFQEYQERPLTIICKCMYMCLN